VVVQVLVHQDGPLFGREGSEEGVGMGGAGGGAGCGEAVDHAAQAGGFDFEIAIVLHDYLVDGEGVFAHGLVVAEDERLDEGAEDAADEFSRWVEVSERHFEACGTVGHRLGSGHRAPLASSVRLQRCEARFDFVRCCGIEQVFHA